MMHDFNGGIDYDYFVEPTGYFTLLMVKSSTFQVKSHRIIFFPSTKQGRNLTVVSVSGTSVFKMNTAVFVK